MVERLKQIIEYATSGNKAKFAKIMGWKEQYLQNMLKGNSIGITPISTILAKISEINARWLILGQGEMFDVIELRRAELDKAAADLSQIRDLITTICEKNVQNTCAAKNDEK